MSLTHESREDAGDVTVVPALKQAFLGTHGSVTLVPRRSLHRYLLAARVPA